MKYYIAFDGGGTKIEAILFDENLKLVSHRKAGSMNTSSSDYDLVVKNAHDCAVELLKDTGVTEIECVYGVFSHIIRDELKKVIKVNNIDDRGGEGLIGLLSGFVTGDAVITLSGTGSVIFASYDGKCYEAGGYGSVIHDEGSGYHMGRMAFAAAIADFEERGEKTLITDCICRKMGVKTLPDATGKVYDYPGKSPIATVAMCAVCVGEAARMGDKIAQELLTYCGRNLAEQTLGLICKRNIPMDIPIVIEGGHFKNDIRIVNEFKRVIKEKQPNREVVVPYFEPIVGAVMAMPYFNRIELSFEKKEWLKEEYKDFRFIIKE